MRAARAPPAAAAAPDSRAITALEMELDAQAAAAKRREEDLGARMGALEAELGALRNTKADLTERVAELAERLQVQPALGVAGDQNIIIAGTSNSWHAVGHNCRTN